MKRTIQWGLLALLFQSAVACAHVRGVTRTWVEVVPVEGTELGDGSAPTEIVLQGRAEFEGENAILRGSIRARGAGTQEFQVQSWQEISSNSYDWAEVLILKPLTAAVFFGILGPLWMNNMHDYGGDGRVGLFDRTRFCIAMLNPFEAFPLSHEIDKESVLAGEERERREAIVDLGGIPAELELVLTSARGTTQLMTRTEDGQFEIPLDAGILEVFGSGFHGTLQHPESDTSLKIEEFFAPTVGEYLMRTGVLSRTETEEDRELRKFVEQVFTGYANSGSATRLETIELFRKCFELKGIEPDIAVSSTLDLAEQVTLTQAIQDGRIEVSVRGRDLRGVSMTLVNRDSAPLRVVIPAGMFFGCQGTAQDMVSTRSQEVRLFGSSTSSHALSAACANMNKATPRGTDAFVIEELKDPRLKAIAPYLHALKYNALQAVVWILTDDATKSNFARYSTPRIGRKEILQAAALFEYAGVDIEDRAIQSWLQEESADVDR